MTSSNGNIFGGHWPFMWGIHWSLVNSPHKGQWCEYLMWSAPGTKGWVNNHEAGDLRCHHVHYDVIVMKFLQVLWWPTLLPIHTCILIRLQNKVIFLHNTHKVHSIAHQRGQGMDLNMFGTWLCFYQSRSAWSVDQGPNKNHSPAYNFAPTVTQFCVMWEGLSLPHDTKFGNCRCTIVDNRAFPSWSLIHGLCWSGLIKAEPERLL